MSTFNTDKLQDMQSKNIDLLQEVNEKFFESFEQLTQFQLKALKASSEEGFANLRKLLTANDPQSFANLQMSMSQPTAYAERILDFNRQVYDLISKTQASMGKLAENQVGQSNSNVKELIDGIIKNAPAGTEPLVSVLKATLENGSVVYENLQEAAKKVAEMAETNINAATSAANKAAKKAAANNK